MGDYIGRHRPLVSVFRERKRGARATCIRFAAAVLLIGAVLASAGFLNRRPAGQTEGHGPTTPPRPTQSISDGLLSMSAVTPSPSAGPAGAPSTGPAPASGRTSPPPTGGGVAIAKGGPVGAWNFEEGTGSLASDSSGFSRAAMLCDGSSWGAGRDSRSSLRLTASDGCAYATGSMLRTDSGFTVSAWVNLDIGAGESVALAQEGTAASGFYLMYDAQSGRWAMKMPRFDGAATDYIEAFANGPATPGRWTHLAGVYDPAARQVRIHVNGARAGTAAHPGMMWRALGYFFMGRARHSGDEFHRWQGSIDEVRVFDYALSDQQITGLFGGKG